MHRSLAVLTLLLFLVPLSCETQGTNPISPDLTSAEGDKIKVKDDVIKGPPPQVVAYSNGPGVSHRMLLWEVGTTTTPKDLTPAAPTGQSWTTPRAIPGSWSPKGTQLAFAAGEHDKTAGRYTNIAVMSVATNGSAVPGSTIWVTSKTTGQRLAPAWSPNGSNLAWLCPTSAGQGICLSTFSGGSWGPEQVAEYWDGSVKKPVLTRSQPSWSPRSDQLIFSNNTGLPGDHMEIYTYDIAAETVTEWLLPAGFDDDKETPVWETKPGSKRILFSYYEGTDEYNIYTWELGSSQAPVAVVSQTGQEWTPWWGPDGKQFTFGTGDTRTGTDVWVVNADGTSAVNLTNSAVSGNFNWFARLRPR